MAGNYSPIFARFRARRIALQLSQGEVARRAGITQTYLSKIEKGKIEPRLHTLEDLARALRLELTLVPAEAAPALHSLLPSGEAPKPLFAAEPD